MSDEIAIDYNGLIPNNVGLNEDHVRSAFCSNPLQLFNHRRRDSFPAA